MKLRTLILTGLLLAWGSSAQAGRIFIPAEAGFLDPDNTDPTQVSVEIYNQAGVGPVFYKRVRFENDVSTVADAMYYKIFVPPDASTNLANWSGKIGWVASDHPGFGQGGGDASPSGSVCIKVSLVLIDSGTNTATLNEASWTKVNTSISTTSITSDVMQETSISTSSWSGTVTSNRMLLVRVNRSTSCSDTSTRAFMFVYLILEY